MKSYRLLSIVFALALLAAVPAAATEYLVAGNNFVIRQDTKGAKISAITGISQAIFYDVKAQDGTIAYASYGFSNNAVPNGIAVINLALNAITSTIPTGSVPARLTFDPKRKLLYVPHQVGVDVFDVSNAPFPLKLRTIDFASVGTTVAFGQHVGLLPNGTLATLTQSGDVLFGTSLAFTHLIHVGGSCEYAIISSDGTKLFVFLSGSVAVTDAEGNVKYGDIVVLNVSPDPVNDPVRILNVIDKGSKGSTTFAVMAGARIYVPSADGSLYAFDPAAQTMSGSMMLGGALVGIMYGSDGKLYVCDNATGTIRIVKIGTEVSRDRIGSPIPLRPNDRPINIAEIPPIPTGPPKKWPPAITVTPTDLTFDPILVGKTLPHSFTITNSGGGTLSINSISIAPDVGYVLESPATPFNLASQASQVVNVTFAPTYVGSFNTTLAIASNDATTPLFAIPVSGTAAPASKENAGPPGGSVLTVLDPTHPQVIYASNQYSLFKTVDAAAHWFTLPDIDSAYITGHILAVDPTNSEVLYAAASPSTVYTSTDAGYTWTSSSSGLPATYVWPTGLLVDKGNTSTLYVAYYGAGLYRSIDRAASWTSLNPPDLYVNNLLLDPITPGYLYVGTNSGVYKSITNGASWFSANSGLPAIPVTSLAIDPSDSLVLYAATQQGVYRSTDGGLQWHATALLSPITVVATTPTVVYAGGEYGLFRSTDAFDHWEMYASGLYTYKVRSISVHPNNSSIIYVGTAGGGVFKSSDGGRNWVPSSSGLPASHVVALADQPNSTGVIYSTIENAGVFKTTDGGVKWSAANIGLENQTVTSVAVDAFDKDVVFVGTVGASYGGSGSDVVFKSTNGGQQWTPASVGLPSTYVSMLTLDPFTLGTIYAVVWPYGIYRSQDAGTIWTSASNGLGSGIVSIGVDPTAPGILLAGSVGSSVDIAYIYRSVDGGMSWTRYENIGGYGWGFYAFAFDAAYPGTVYVAANEGIYVTANNGESWTRLGFNAGSPHTIYIDPYDSNNLFLNHGGYIYRSTDRGVSWNNVSQHDIGSCFSFEVAFDGMQRGTLYASTEHCGVFKSTDGGSSWKPTGSK